MAMIRLDTLDMFEQFSASRSRTDVSTALDVVASVLLRYFSESDIQRNPSGFTIKGQPKGLLNLFTRAEVRVTMECTDSATSFRTQGELGVDAWLLVMFLFGPPGAIFIAVVIGLFFLVLRQQVRDCFSLACRNLTFASAPPGHPTGT